MTIGKLETKGTMTVLKYRNVLLFLNEVFFFFSYLVHSLTLMLAVEAVFSEVGGTYTN